MLYFSELNHKKVITTKGKFLGYLDDLIFTVIGTPYIKKFVVNCSVPFWKKKERLIIPAENYQKQNSSTIVVLADFKPAEIEENELFVKKNLLDTQVIDIEENNIVRVNDVLIQTVNSHGFIISGVDIGLAGILRWFRMEEPFLRGLHFFGKTVPQYTVAWSDIQPLELTRGRVALNYRFDRIKNLHPADLADYLETQNFKNVVAFLEGMDKKYLAQVISELNPNFQINFFRRISTEKAAFIISIMDPDDAVDVLSEFPRKKREDIINRLTPEQASQIRRLFSLNRTPLGEFLNVQYTIVSPGQTAYDVVRKIKKETTDFSYFEYVYVANKENQLVGIFNLHELLTVDSNTEVFRFMSQRVIVANLHTPVDVAFLRMIKYKISSLPIVDGKKRIIGIVTIDDLGDQVLKRLEG